MLIGESSYVQAVCLRALNNARPTQTHRNVCMPDFLEGRIKISMLRAHLNLFVKFAARTPVIDGDYIPTLQVHSDAIDPIKRGLVKVRIVMPRAVNENKLVAF